MPLRILITGGAGFIGSRTALRLLELGHHVTVLDNLSPQIHGDNPDLSPTYQLIRGRCEFIRASVLDAAVVKNAVAQTDVIFHLAAETGTGQSMYEVARYVEVNLTATAHLAEAVLAGRDKKPRVVLASSRAIYGEGTHSCPVHGHVHPVGRLDADLSAGHFELRCPVCQAWAKPVPTNESAALQPLSVYAATKLGQEQLLRTALTSAGIATVFLRYQNVYGPGQSLRNPYTGIISIFSKAILGDRVVNIFEDGLESRDFVFIDDVVAANVAAATLAVPSGIAVNVGTGIPTSVLDVYRTLAAAYQRPEQFRISGEYRIGDIRHCYADATRLRDVLGIVPRTSFQQGIAAMAAWVQSESTRGGTAGGAGYEQSLEELRRLNLLKK